MSDSIHRPVFISILRLTSLLRIQTYLKRIEDIYKQKYYSHFLFLHQSLSSQIEHAITKIISYITPQFSSLYTLNYVYRDLPSQFPDDIDDTFSALFTIESHKPGWTSSSKLATIIYTLDKIRDKQSPILFNTWYTPHITDGTWDSLDFVALSSIVAYFESVSIPTDELKTYTINSMRKFTAATSEFYPYGYLAVYLLSRIHIPKQDFEEILDHLDTQTIYESEDKGLVPQPSWYKNLLITSRYWQHYILNEQFKYTPHIPIAIMPGAEHTGAPLYIEYENQRSYAEDSIFDQLIYIESIFGQIVHDLSYYTKEKASCISLTHYLDIESCKDIVYTHIQGYIQTTTYIDEIKEKLYSELKRILNSKDFRILHAIYCDIARLYLTQNNRTNEDEGVHRYTYLKDFSTLLYAYYLYDQMADDIDTHYLLPFFVSTYRAGITSLHKAYMDHNIQWDEAENILHTCDRLYISLFRFGSRARSLTDHSPLLSDTTLQDHAYKSIGLQVFLPFICQQIDIWTDPLSYISWYSPIASYSKYILLLFEKAISALQFTRQLADDFDDFDEDIKSQKITTAYYFLNPNIPKALDRYTMQLFLHRHLDTSEMYVSILKHLPIYMQKLTTLTCIDEMITSIKNNLIRKKRDKVVLKELERLHQYYTADTNPLLVT